MRACACACVGACACACACNRAHVQERCGHTWYWNWARTILCMVMQCMESCTVGCMRAASAARACLSSCLACAAVPAHCHTRIMHPSFPGGGALPRAPPCLLRVFYHHWWSAPPPTQALCRDTLWDCGSTGTAPATLGRRPTATAERGSSFAECVLGCPTHRSLCRYPRLIRHTAGGGGGFAALHPCPKSTHVWQSAVINEAAGPGLDTRASLAAPAGRALARRSSSRSSRGWPRVSRTAAGLATTTCEVVAGPFA